MFKPSTPSEMKLEKSVLTCVFLDGWFKIINCCNCLLMNQSLIVPNMRLCNLIVWLSLQESRPAPWAASRRLSPGPPLANKHAQNAAAKRRQSYDYNRNITD